MQHPKMKTRAEATAREAALRRYMRRYLIRGSAFFFPLVAILCAVVGESANIMAVGGVLAGGFAVLCAIVVMLARRRAAEETHRSSRQ